jgi:1,4-dihydroxy-2-naphthoate octaprenyltransferase
MRQVTVTLRLDREVTEKENPMPKNQCQIWWIAIRPTTLWIAVSPVMIGVAIAYHDGVFKVMMALCALLAALFIQIATNFSNDYFDGIKGTDNCKRLGEMRVVQAGLVKPETMHKAMWGMFALFFVLALLMSLQAGWFIIVLAIVSIISGYMYTGGPYPLGYYGLGDIFAFLFFGPIAVAGTYFVQSQDLTYVVLIAGIAPGLFSVAILTVNNLRDIIGDCEAGKKTLAVRFGVNFARWEYLMAMILIALLPLLLVLMTGQNRYALITILTSFMAIPLIKIVFSDDLDGASLNQTLVSTAKLLLFYSILFSIGWLI